MLTTVTYCAEGSMKAVVWSTIKSYIITNSLF